MVLDWASKRAAFDLSVIGFAGFAVNTAFGFIALTRGVTNTTRFAIAFGYVPAMFGILFMETLYISVRFLGGDNF